MRFIHPGVTSQSLQPLVRRGDLKPLVRGVYLEKGEDPSTAVQEHALLLVAYRYFEARLMGASALRAARGLSPAVGGVVYIMSANADGRRARDVAPGLSVLARPQDGREVGSRTHSIKLDEGFFQPIVVPSTYGALRDAVLYPDCAGDAEEMKAAVDTLSLEERASWMRLAGHAQAYAQWSSAQKEPESAPEQSILLFLQDQPCGAIRHNGVAWAYRQDETLDLPLQSSVIPQIKAFVQSVLPEANDAIIARYGDDERVYLQEPRRLMNLTCIPESLAGTVKPVRNAIAPGAELVARSENGVFRGHFEGRSLGDALAHASSQGLAPKLSGMQPKFGAWLDTQGTLRESSERDPFNILVKTDPGQSMSRLAGIPVLEWACLRAAKLAGLPGAESALMVDSEGKSAALLSERFDVPHGDDRTLHLSVDLTALLGMRAADKYRLNIRHAWNAIKEASAESSHGEIGRALFDRLALAWAMGDGDAHAKNISMLLSRNPGGGWRVALAPAYDTVCTRAIEGMGQDRQAIAIEGKDDNLSPKTWKRFGDFLGVPRGDERASAISGRFAAALSGVIRQGLPKMDDSYTRKCRALLHRAEEVSHHTARFMGHPTITPYDPSPGTDWPEMAAS